MRPHFVGAPFGAARHVGGVLGERADAGDREQRFQLFQIAVAVDVDEIDDVVHSCVHVRICHENTKTRNQNGNVSCSCFRSFVADQVLATPTAGLVRSDDAVGFQLREMRAHVFARGRHQRRVESIIDGFGNRLHRRAAGMQGIQHLTLAHAAVSQLGREDRRRVVDAPAVRGQQRAGLEREQPLERCEVLPEIAAPARVNHDAAAEDHQVARENRPRRLVPERDVIRRVPGCVERRQPIVADGHRVAVCQRAPGDLVPRVFVRPRMLREHGGGMLRRNRRRTRGVIRVAVRHEHVIQAASGRRELAGEIGQMLRVAHARVDERRAPV